MKIFPSRGRMKRRGKSGVTLIELMVAIVCLSVLMLAFINVFKTLAMLWMKGVGRVETYQGLGIATARISSELRSALPPYVEATEINFVGVNNPAGTPTNTSDDWIRFHAPVYSSYEGVDKSPSAGLGSDIERVDYWLKNDNGSLQIQRGMTASKSGHGSGSPALATADTIPNNAATNPAGSNNPFAYKIGTFTVKYRAGVASTWNDAWDARTSGALPRLIRVKFEAAGTSGDSTTRVLVLYPHARGTSMK